MKQVRTKLLSISDKLPEYIAVYGALLILIITLKVCFEVSISVISFSIAKSMVEHILMSVVILSGGVAALQYAIVQAKQK